MTWQTLTALGFSLWLGVGSVLGDNPEVSPPRYKYAVFVASGPGGPKGLHFSNNLFHPGTAGVANVELRR